MPTFSRQTTGDTTEERPANNGSTVTKPHDGSTVTKPNESTTTRWDGPRSDDRTEANRAARVNPAEVKSEKAESQPAKSETAKTSDKRSGTAGAHSAPPPPPPPAREHRDEPTTQELRPGDDRQADEPGRPGETPPAVGPKPRASLMATLSLILGVAAALLVLSGPLMGYGIGVAGLGLVLALFGIRATSRRHVAGKTDALIGMVLSLAAIVVGILALTGSLNWLGTDMQPVQNAREWLDAQFVDRF
ncbi:hypothetical protein GCM10012284_39750 [Mangrovihabitans endophyticus]|uniref:Thrombospondin n=2 Tax=Mangrovihabitans endophyticus TaxID=1751298 RepID=A0A8J3C338_9ACTN|nr:hypothetical protein GCM10012284_39750 [Mangrovihabitans endophyticus]